ncbi:hypothetical protein M2110_003705 [Paenibacillus sp. PastF-4]|nr:hypothetical protein [Paenibacillus sp. PastF-4]
MKVEIEVTANSSLKSRNLQTTAGGSPTFTAVTMYTC